MSGRNGSEHHVAPIWANWISTGNVLTLLGGLVVAAFAWGKIDTMQTSQAADLKAVEDRAKERVESVQREVANNRQDMQRIEAKIDRLLMEVRSQR